MSQPNWPGTTGFPALAYRSGYGAKSLQLPFATGNSETDAPEIFWGTGNPNGVVTAVPGDSFHATDTGYAWCKLAGTGNTGWIVVGRTFDLLAYGAKGDGTTDDTAAVQGAFTAAAGVGPVYVPSGKTFKITSTITYPVGTTVMGDAGTAAIGKFLWAGTSGGTMFAPANPAQANEFVRFKCVELDGSSLAGVGVDCHYVSHGTVEDCYVHNVSQSPGIGVWFYRDPAVGFAAYYNHVLRGRISACTVGVLFDGNGATQTNGPNSNWVQHVDLLANGTSVFQKYGNDLLLFGNASEAPTTCHFEVAGAGCHILANRIENAGGTPLVPGIQVDATAMGVVEAFNYYATFTNDPVVDNQVSGDHIVRNSTFGSGVNGGAQGLAQVTVLNVLGRLFGNGDLDLNGGTFAGSTGTVRVNRSSAAAGGGDAMQWFNGSATLLAGLSALGALRLKGAVLPGTDAGATQTGQVFMGSGVPSNSNGNNGDVYFRTDTPASANQRLYNKQAGSWVGIL